jgi:hypothetical protein
MHQSFHKNIRHLSRKYLTQLKLGLAKQLLVSTNRTVEDIAGELGFHSASHFSRQFRRGTGMSPNQFRPATRYRIELHYSEEVCERFCYYRYVNFNIVMSFSLNRLVLSVNIKHLGACKKMTERICGLSVIFFVLLSPKK